MQNIGPLATSEGTTATSAIARPVFYSTITSNAVFVGSAHANAVTSNAVFAGNVASNVVYANAVTASNAITSANVFVTGSVGVRTAAPLEPLHVVGNAYIVGGILATGDITAFSDARLKTDLRELADAVQLTQRLTGYTYLRVDTDQRCAGLLAQQVQAVLPEAVRESHGALAVSYNGVVALLVQGIKELASRVEALERGG